MTVTDQQVSVVIADDGTIKLPQHALDVLGTRRIKLVIKDGEMTVSLRPEYLHEIEDTDQRLKAFDEFIGAFAVKTGVTWPENYDVREDLYD